jgi:hypothetical protein
LNKKIVLIGLFLVFGLVIYGCVTNKEAAAAPVETSVTAMGVPEGIVINFENLPTDTNRLFIMLKDATENDEMLTFVDIRGNELETVKSTGELICPFTIKGHVYRISVIPYAENDSFREECINVAAIASGGNYPRERPLMRLNGENYVPAADMPVYIEALRSLNYGDTPWVIGITKKDDYIALLK